MNSVTLINKRYVIFGVLLYFILLPRLESTYSALYFVNILFFIAYCITISSQASQADYLYNANRLCWIIFGFGFIFITLNNFISFIYNQNYFVFSAIDAGVYHLESIVMSKKSLGDSIDYFLKEWTFEDLGAVLVISSFYRLFSSNLIINSFYLFLSILSGLGIFRISKYLMRTKYAYFASLTFSTSSFYIWFNSSGLKESVMIFLTIFSFLQYYHFMKTKSLKYIFYAIPLLLALMLFRPAVVFLIIGSILISYLLGRKRNYVEFFVVIVLIVSLVFGYPYLNQILDRFIGEGLSRMIEIKELDGLVKGSVEFTYMVNILAGIIGPLPTVLPNIKPALSFYAPGLIYKALISIPFWLGIYTIYRRNLYIFYPIATFVVLESASLILILEGLELRKSMPHFPFIFIVSFAFLSYLDQSKSSDPLLWKRMWKLFNISFLVVFGLILYWNFRF